MRVHRLRVCSLPNGAEEKSSVLWIHAATFLEPTVLYINQCLSIFFDVYWSAGGMPISA